MFESVAASLANQPQVVERSEPMVAVALVVDSIVPFEKIRSCFINNDSKTKIVSFSRIRLQINLLEVD